MTLRIAIIGCGAVGRHHLREALATSGCTVAALCDLAPGAAAALAQEYRLGDEVCVTTDVDGVLVDPTIDGVVLALPTSVRQPLALRALAAGKHLLLEKPMGLCAADIAELERAQGDRTVACCSARMSLMAHARRAREAVADGALGTLRSIHCWATTAAGPRPIRPPPAWRLSRALNGGGILMNWGIYDLDLLFGLSGWTLEPVTVSARTWGVAADLADRAAPGSDGETHLTALVRFACGAALVYERGEFTAAQPRADWQLLGERGALRLHLFDATAPVHLDRADPTDGVSSSVLHHAPTATADFMLGPLADWAQAITAGRPPCTGLAQARRLALLTDAIYASARSGAEVRLGARGHGTAA